jgi:hypothetical protein
MKQSHQDNGDGRRDRDHRHFDVQEEIKKRRLDDIATARRDVREARKKSKQWLAEGGNPNIPNEYLHEAVSAFLTELYPHRHLDPGYWTGEELDGQIGYLEVSPPEPPNDRGRNDRWTEVGEGFGKVSGDNLEPTVLAVFDGLDDIHSHRTRYTHTWKCSHKPKNLPPKQYESTREYSVPRWVLLKGVEVSVDFARSVGLEIEATGEDRWEV